METLVLKLLSTMGDQNIVHCKNGCDLSCSHILLTHASVFSHVRFETFVKVLARSAVSEAQTAMKRW